MGIKEDITNRFNVLIDKGGQLLGTISPLSRPIDQYGNRKVYPDRYEYWVPQKRSPEFKSWLISASNLVHFVVLPESPLAKDCDSIMAHKDLEGGVTSNALVLMIGLLRGVKDEWEHGFLAKIEYIVAGATFGDFLDQAAEYHRGNNKMEAAVLSCAVLEDTVKKIAQKNGIQTSGKTLEPLINALVKANVLKSVKSKRVKAWVGVRNHTHHAEWDEFEISDVGALIDGTRELIENYL